MSLSVFAVEIENARFAACAQVHTNEKWTKALSLGHRQDVTFCLCNGRVPLSIKLYGKDTGNSHYGLARWPDTGLDHDPLCQYFGENTKDGDVGDTLPAFHKMDDGLLRVHLAMSLSPSETRVVNPDASKSKARVPGRTRQRAGEITVLTRLWRDAGLNVYFAKPRGWFRTSYAILNTAASMVVSKDGTSLADVLLVGTQDDDKMALAHNATALAAANAKKSRLFVIGRLRKPDWSKQKQLLPLLDFKGLPKVMVDTVIIERFMKNRPFLHNLVTDRSGNVVVFACIESTGGEWWKVVSITGMPTSKNMVPLESGFELEFDQYLVSNSRKFIKPVVLGEIEQDELRPDFILLDTKPRLRCEVWGMQTADYRVSKAKRIEAYAQKGQSLLSWSANPREPFPVLPPALSSSQEPG